MTASGSHSVALFCVCYHFRDNHAVPAMPDLCPQIVPSKWRGTVKVWLQVFSTSVLDGNSVVSLALGQLYPIREARPPISVWYEAGWAPEPVWTRWRRERSMLRIESLITELAVSHFLTELSRLILYLLDTVCVCLRVSCMTDWVLGSDDRWQNCLFYKCCYH
jgi:hypothetical protein